MVNKIIKTAFFSFVIIVSVNVKSFSQNNAAAIAAADSTGFSTGNTNGWQLFNSYVAPYKTDSAQLEIIIQHANNINWSQEQFVGKIKISSLVPHNTQTVSYNLMNTVYTLRIKDDGKCYLKFVSGSLPITDPAIIPVKVYYKK